MPIELVCGACGKDLKVKDDLIGKKVKCPGCQTIIRIPDPAAAAPPARPAREPARGAPRRAAPGRRRERDPARDDDPAPEGGRPRFQRKKGIPDWVWIPLVLLVILAVAYPVVTWRREKNLYQTAEADYQEAQRRLAKKDGQTAANIMKATVAKLRDVQADDATMFRFQSFYAQTLLDSNPPDRDTAQEVLRACADVASGAGDQARLTHLRAQAHQDQTDYRTIFGYYTKSLEAKGDKPVAEEALVYAERQVAQAATNVEDHVSILLSTREAAANFGNPTAREANQKRIPLDEDAVRDKLEALERVIREAAKLLEVAAEAAPDAARGARARIDRSVEKARGVAQEALNV
jgi:hypothetical protein